MRARNARLRAEKTGTCTATSRLNEGAQREAARGGFETLRVDVRRFDCAFEVLAHGVRVAAAPATPRDGCNDLFEVMGRPIARVAEAEQRLGSLDPQDPAALRAGVQVPYGEGSWLVYLRQAGRLRCRPVLVARAPATCNDAPGVLPALMAVTDRQQREQALGQAMDRAATDCDSEILREIACLIRSVSGELPAQTLDPIRLLPEHPAAALRVLAMADETDIDTLLGLEAELPLSWQWLPLDHWCGAFEAEWKAWHIQLSQRGLAHFADDAIRGRLQCIVRQEPRLAPHAAIVLHTMGLAADNRLDGALAQCVRELQLPAPTLKAVAEQRSRAAAGECFKRSIDRQWPGRPSFREGTAPALPGFIGGYAGFTHAVLDAPHVAAQIACGERAWSHRLERLLRTNRAYDPSYFDEVLAMQCVVAWRSRTTTCR